jgi:hypothetical protein
MSVKLKFRQILVVYIILPHIRYSHLTLTCGTGILSTKQCNQIGQIQMLKIVNENTNENLKNLIYLTSIVFRLSVFREIQKS